ncbi:MAG: YebC/PmpR family DNA-binding transcriptional regulator [Proteobacteria bacterium]|nr:MAG: YebC/PmpR family DNA-binding transcriptional regulator [Pseudomonadota bacterium]
MGRKSSKIALRKGAADKARGQLYTRMLKDVFKASKGGSSEITANFLLKVSIEKAKKFNVPREHIEKAIKKGQGELGAGYQDISYEGYGQGGVAVFVEASTDNPTRTIANIRTAFKKCNGSLGTPGSLEFVFSHKAQFEIVAEGVNEEEFTMHMIDAGADDVELDEGFFVVTAPKDAFGAIQVKLQEIHVTPEEASLIRIPSSKKEVDEETVTQIEKLIDLLESDDDVVTVYHNLENEI